MDSAFSRFSGFELFAWAALGEERLRERIEHELDRRAVRALVRRLLREPLRQARASASRPMVALAV